MNLNLHPKKTLISMVTQAVKLNAELRRDVSVLQSEVSLLKSNAKKWVKKFRGSHIKEVEDWAVELEQELRTFKETAISEIARLKREKTELIDMVNDLKYSSDDMFGFADDSSELTLELADDFSRKGLTERQKDNLEREIKVRRDATKDRS